MGRSSKLKLASLAFLGLAVSVGSHAQQEQQTQAAPASSGACGEPRAGNRAQGDRAPEGHEQPACRGQDHELHGH